MTKAELVNGLKEEYQNWQALLDQIGPARMDQPGVTGTWSIKDIIRSPDRLAKQDGWSLAGSAARSTRTAAALAGPSPNR